MQQQSHPFLVNLDKKTRNLNKKLKDIQELLQKQKNGSELKEEQKEKVSQQAQIQAQVDEIAKYKQQFIASEKEGPQIQRDLSPIDYIVTLFQGLKLQNSQDIVQLVQSTLENMKENPETEIQNYLQSDLYDQIKKNMTSKGKK